MESENFKQDGTEKSGAKKGCASLICHDLAAFFAMVVDISRTEQLQRLRIGSPSGRGLAGGTFLLPRVTHGDEYDPDSEQHGEGGHQPGPRQCCGAGVTHEREDTGASRPGWPNERLLLRVSAWGPPGLGNTGLTT